MSNVPNPERNQNSPAVTRAFSLDTTRDSQPGSASENAEELDFDVSVEVSAKNTGTKTKNPIFGEYVILDRIGAGGMGQVYRAHKTHLPSRGFIPRSEPKPGSCTPTSSPRSMRVAIPLDDTKSTTWLWN